MKISTFSLSSLSEPYNTVLSDVRRFKGSKGAYSTKRSEGVQEAARRRYLTIEGDKISDLPRTSRFDELTPVVSSWLLDWQTNEASAKHRTISQEHYWPWFPVKRSTVRL